jgi:hypothetical protein
VSRQGIGRRAILEGGLAALLAAMGSRALGGERIARADETDPEHFFLFVEFKGGMNWMIGTDGPDVDRLPMTDTSIVRQVAVARSGETPRMSMEAHDTLFAGAGARVDHGNVIMLPVFDDGTPAQTYVKRTTSAGTTCILGVGGGPLVDVMNDIAVVRGVRGMSIDHGVGSDQAFSGYADDPAPHVGGVLAKLLAEQRGAKILDNLVFEGAAFARPDSEHVVPPILTDVATLSRLVSTGEDMTSDAFRAGTEKIRSLAQAVYAGAPVGRVQQEAFGVFLASLGNVPHVRDVLRGIGDRIGSAPANANLDAQVDGVLSLFEEGLTRVATVCLGNSAGANLLYDAHAGVIHPGETPQHQTHVHVRTAMQSLARLVAELKRRRYNGRSLWEQTTVVATTEFSRTTNGSGDNGDVGAYGDGHWKYNNNYVIMGKGVRGGAWIGQNHAVTQYHHLVDLATLEQNDPSRIVYTAPSYYTLDASSQAYQVGAANELDLETSVNWEDGPRPFMAKDIVRTLLRIANVETSFVDVYPGAWFRSARVIRPLLG